LKDLPTSRRRSVVFRPINRCRVLVRRLRNPAIKSRLLRANGTVPRLLPREKTSRINGLTRRRGIPFYLAMPPIPRIHRLDDVSFRFRRRLLATERGTSTLSTFGSVAVRGTVCTSFFCSPAPVRSFAGRSPSNCRRPQREGSGGRCRFLSRLAFRNRVHRLCQLSRTLSAKPLSEPQAFR
jgi:hypothetical protein